MCFKLATFWYDQNLNLSTSHPSSENWNHIKITTYRNMFWTLFYTQDLHLWQSYIGQQRGHSCKIVKFQNLILTHIARPISDCHNCIFSNFTFFLSKFFRLFCLKLEAFVICTLFKLIFLPPKCRWSGAGAPHTLQVNTRAAGARFFFTFIWKHETFEITTLSKNYNKVDYCFLMVPLNSC